MMKMCPVVIPTLNRYQHLKRCVESLATCRYAAETELYISVDYPPSEKYREGYDRVLEYVNGGIAGFKAVHVFFQEKNLGTCDNTFFLYSKVFEKYDRLIYTEDDNEFSVNFLDYMNKMLTRYENDSSVYAISGYCWPVDLPKRGEAFMTPFTSAWGRGLWKKRIEEFAGFRRNEIASFLRNAENRKALKKHSIHVYKGAVYIAADKHYMRIYRGDSEEFWDADFVLQIYQYLRGMKTVMPYITKVKNFGHDGSGLNCDDTSGEIFEKQLIDERQTFDVEDAIELNADELDILRHYIDNGERTSLKERIKLFLMVATGLNV